LTIERIKPSLDFPAGMLCINNKSSMTTLKSANVLLLKLNPDDVVLDVFFPLNLLVDVDSFFLNVIVLSALWILQFGHRLSAGSGILMSFCQQNPQIWWDKTQILVGLQFTGTLLHPI